MNVGTPLSLDIGLIPFLGRRVLVVDDEADNLFLLSSLLRKNYHVETAISGEEALQKYIAQPFDLIIADQRMPGMDGLTLCEKAVAHHPDSICIIITAYSDRDVLLSALEGGHIFRVMLKPWDRRDMTMMVEQALVKLAYRRATTSLIQELKYKNEALKQSNRALELSYVELKQAQEEKLQNERLASIGRFTTQVVHEINNQLSTLGVLRAMQDSIREIPELGGCIDYVIEANENLLHMVEGLRRFARGDAYELQLEEVDLQELVHGVVMFVSNSLMAEGVEFVESYEAIPPVKVDRLGFKQVLLNLLRNAVQALRDKRVVKVAVNHTSSRELQIRIQDYGVGIAEENRDLIFAPFFTTKEHRGLGLGLQVSQQMLEKHGGTLRFESEVGEGTTFVLSLPLSVG